MGVAKGLKVPCLFMITEVSIRCQKNPGGWCTAYRVYTTAYFHLSLGLQEREREQFCERCPRCATQSPPGTR